MSDIIYKFFSSSELEDNTKLTCAKTICALPLMTRVMSEATLFPNQTVVGVGGFVSEFCNLPLLGPLLPTMSWDHIRMDEAGG